MSLLADLPFYLCPQVSPAAPATQPPEFAQLVVDFALRNPAWSVRRDACLLLRWLWYCAGPDLQPPLLDRIWPISQYLPLAGAFGCAADSFRVIPFMSCCLKSSVHLNTCRSGDGRVRTCSCLLDRIWPISQSLPVAGAFGCVWVSCANRILCKGLLCSDSGPELARAEVAGFALTPLHMHNVAF